MKAAEPSMMDSLRCQHLVLRLVRLVEQSLVEVVQLPAAGTGLYSGLAAKITNSNIHYGKECVTKQYFSYFPTKTYRRGYSKEPSQ